ncbi:MAG: LysM peptidoglycan-binding domain-containing protein [Planctomycetaceae bacterium]|nr:LysM peptidoglycan-binding domain-containing protein [Planctomycetaceae bacterium]
MSARARWKYRQAQKHGLKPQIPDGADEDSFVDFQEIEVEQTSRNDSTAAPKNKGGIFSVFAAIFRFVRRIIVSIFTKAKNIQQSYLESITAEGPKEQKITVFSQNRELNREKNLPSEDPLLEQQIEATSRQLTELSRSPSPELLKQEHEKAGEEEFFNEDDFDEAVRRARWKLVTAAALVCFCLGGVIAYQFVSVRGAKEHSVASQENPGEKKEPVFEKDDDFFSSKTTVQLATQNPPVAHRYSTPEIEEEPDFAAMSVSPVDPLDTTFGENPEESATAWDLPSVDLDLMNNNEDVLTEQPKPSMLPSSLSLASSQPVQAELPRTLQGETQGALITISDSPVAGLPLPQTPALAKRTAPAAPFASQYQENDEASSNLDASDNEPLALKLAVPNQRYQNAVAIQTPSSETRRALPFGQTPAPVETKTLAVQNENRQYTIQDGDNLFNIAKRELGDVTRWREIYRLNRDTIGDNAGYLTPGTVISIPE